MTTATLETKRLHQILVGVEHRVKGNMDRTVITGVSSDSRKVQPGNMFAAIKGLNRDGHDYLDQAVAAGCAALLVDKNRLNGSAAPPEWSQVTVVAVDDTKTALGTIAANFYEHPERELTMIGITGTNGKTTTSFLVESLLKACGRRTGVIGTVNYRYQTRNGEELVLAAPFTTPESPALFGLLRKMADENITDVIMEVSSHGLAQSRLTGLDFDIAVFTNLSRDHLDFHPDMRHYFESKRLLFTDYLKPGGRIVIVLDGAKDSSSDSQPDWSGLLHKELLTLSKGSNNPGSIHTCGLTDNCDIHPRDYTTDMSGTSSEITTPAGNLNLKTPLVGEFNLRNMLCAVGVGIAHNESLECIKKGLEEVQTVPGRLEKVQVEDAAARCPTVFVDYAHTPDALEKVLQAVRKLKPARLVCVFGCGGDRDSGKRPLMGEIAGKLCDVVLATSDNPRSESPEMILKQIEEGLSITELNRGAAAEILNNKTGRGYDIIRNRHTAILTAVRHARPDDVILISGKGHENYQLSSKGKIFFDDRIEAEMHLAAKTDLPHRWKLDWVRQTTGGQLLFPVEGSVVFNNISTDTRTIKPGDLFVALKGENFDGSQFVETALDKGAAGLMINHLPGQPDPRLNHRTGVPVLLVPETLTALGQLASSLRRWYDRLQVIALTGSSGKTTVKEMTGAILSRKHHILKTEGNYNNLIGLPLTLFGLKPEHEIAVLEMGMNRPGEIARLTEIADPDVACIINVQEAHLEGLGDIQGVARAKNELYAGLKPGSRVVVNQDDEIVRSLAESIGQEKITFGHHPEAFVRATDLKSLAEEGMAYVLHIGGQSRPVTIKGLGKHNVTNSLAAAALSYACGSTIDDIVTGLAAFTPYDKRARVEQLDSGIMILNDCYNANPSSMRAALETLLDLKKNHRAAAVLGDMLELGDHSDTAHAKLGRRVKELGLDFLAVFGSQAETVVESARNAGMAESAAQNFRSKDDLVSWLKKLMQEGKIGPGDWFLVKGSRGMHMEEVIELLRSDNSRIKAEGN